MNSKFENFHDNFFNWESKIFDKLMDIVCTKLNNNFLRKVITYLVRNSILFNLFQNTNSIDIFKRISIINYIHKLLFLLIMLNTNKLKRGIRRDKYYNFFRIE